VSTGAAQTEPATQTRYCVNHPDRETLVSCGRCGRPFCTQCLVHTPAGQRCYECAGVRRDYAQRAAVRQFSQAFGAIVLGALVSSLAGFFGLFIAFLAGGYFGQTVGPLVNRRTRPWIYLPILLALFAGAIVGFTISIAFRSGGRILAAPELLLFLIPSIVFSSQFLLYIAITAVAAYMRMR
jgi:hypothetical protein